MALKNDSELRKVHGISDSDRDLIKAFLQGAVYGWIRDRKGDVFAGHDLVGGNNWDWQGTPLIKLFEKHKAGGKDNEGAYDQAAKDLGWLLKEVLNQDKRMFESTHKGLVRGYTWIGEGEA